MRTPLPHDPCQNINAVVGYRAFLNFQTGVAIAVLGIRPGRTSPFESGVPFASLMSRSFDFFCFDLFEVLFAIKTKQAQWPKSQQTKHC